MVSVFVHCFLFFPTSIIDDLFYRTINILVVDRSRSGKSTIIKTLEDSSNFEALSSIGFPETKSPSYDSFWISDPLIAVQYRLNIIDTPGLKKTRRVDDTRTDE